MRGPSPDVAVDPRLAIKLDYNNIVDAEFLRRAVDDRRRFVHGDGWITSAGGEAAPGEILARAHYSRAGRLELLVGLERAIAHLVLIDLALHIRVAAVDQTSCGAALEALRRTMPPDPGTEEHVPVSFWWWEPRGPQEMGRRLPAPPWEDIAINYGRRTLSALDPVMSWSIAPAPGGRLMLWHGAPGTGKTTAVRALAREWQEWADFHFITDPECFFQIPSYLLGTIAERRSPEPSRPWKVLVLEDSGEFLAPDAKHEAGQAVSRLLNVCDGALGQATRSLVLVTTNDPLRTLHPALARPGRCLAQVEFRALDRDEVVRWCKARSVPPPAAEHASLADMFAHAEERMPENRPREFGFAAAGVKGPSTVTARAR
jgi:ATPase family associated with various cellular activities (AAA)